MIKIQLPDQVSKELAELIGIHFGDGSMYCDKKYNYNITYSCNLAKDVEFIDYINSLFSKLFNIRFKKLVNYNKNSIELRIRSKELYDFFSNRLKLPVGRKYNLRIPSYIKENKLFLAAFLRGVFDTDGCVILQKFGKYKYILAKISTKHYNFATDIKDGLKVLGIPSFIIKKNTSINNKIFIGYDVVIRNKNVELFFEIVGSKNPRNIQSFHNKSGDGGKFTKSV